jgi:hypothetical protein
VLQAPERERGPELGLAGQPDVGEPVEQAGDGELALHAGEGGAEAVVDATAEGDVAASVATEEQLVGPGEGGRVAFTAVAQLQQLVIDR